MAENAKTGAIMVTMPPELKARLQAKAAEADLAVSTFVRQLIARTCDYELPVTTGGGAVRKYASKEERDAAMKAREKDRRALVKKLLDEYKAQQTDEAQPTEA